MKWGRNTERTYCFPLKHDRAFVFFSCCRLAAGVQFFLRLGSHFYSPFVWIPIVCDNIIRTEFTVAIWKHGDVHKRENSDQINRACKHQTLLIPMSRKQLTYNPEAEWRKNKNAHLKFDNLHRHGPVISVLFRCAFLCFCCISAACSVPLPAFPSTPVLHQPC